MINEHSTSIRYIMAESETFISEAFSLITDDQRRDKILFRVINMHKDLTQMEIY